MLPQCAADAIRDADPGEQLQLSLGLPDWRDQTASRKSPHSLTSGVVSCNNLGVPYCRRSHGFKLFLVDFRRNSQLELYFVFDNLRLHLNNVSQLNSYIARAKLPLLKCSFWSLIAREPRLRRLADTLYQMDKRLIGDVIQMTPEQLIHDASASLNELELLDKILSSADLRLGSKIASWDSVRCERAR